MTEYAKLYYVPTNSAHNFQLIQSHISVAALHPWRSDPVSFIV